ncbi:MCP four helix bundle domain-containing protein [Candidatus Parabeggiatoa sp. HSG14]|uniref:CHASE3 domain-containing protein n=1 Tax=Candidatus Parabeggiatoa sp. HSG14 TaxID=3055593 RepID=UPI0025A73146|nr:MCP four helix bundle domain-containing protein [Thiotrichales bacterium HSG14]
MFEKMKVSTSLYISFGIIIVFVIMVGLFAVLQVHSLVKLTVKLHHHPLIVSNAVRDVNINIVKIQSRMKEFILTGDNINLEPAKLSISAYEKEAYQYFDVIKEHFIGNKKNVDKVIKLFDEWKPIRKEIMDLHEKGKIDEIAISVLKGKEAQYVAQLKKDLKKLLNVVNIKANQFLEKTHFQVKTLLWLSVFMIVVIVIGGWIVFAILRQVRRPLNIAIGIADAMTTDKLKEHIECETKIETGQLLETIDTIQSQLSKSGQTIENMGYQLQKLEEDKQRLEEDKRRLEEEKVLLAELFRTNQSLDKFFTGLFVGGDEGSSILLED